MKRRKTWDEVSYRLGRSLALAIVVLPLSLILGDNAPKFHLTKNEKKGIEQIKTSPSYKAFKEHFVPALAIYLSIGLLLLFLFVNVLLPKTQQEEMPEKIFVPSTTTTVDNSSRKEGKVSDDEEYDPYCGLSQKEFDLLVLFVENELGLVNNYNVSDEQLADMQTWCAHVLINQCNVFGYNSFEDCLKNKNQFGSHILRVNGKDEECDLSYKLLLISSILNNNQIEDKVELLERLGVENANQFDITNVFVRNNVRRALNNVDNCPSNLLFEVCSEGATEEEAWQAIMEYSYSYELGKFYSIQRADGVYWFLMTDPLR